MRRWPDYFDSVRGESIPADLIGATIVDIGTPEDRTDAAEGGGLVIDYRPARSSEVKRVLLAFNDCGMWQESTLSAGRAT